MWFLPHIRHANTQSISLSALLLAAAGISVSGCAWHTPLNQLLPHEAMANRSPSDSMQTDDRRDPQLAAESDWRGAVTAPDPFQWTSIGRSAGERPLQSVTIGQGGYRVLVIGSLTGDDPQGIRFTEELAKYLHQNSLIVGGLQVTIVRTANPDGEAGGTRSNDNGQIVSRGFPRTDDETRGVSSLEPEVRAVLSLLNEQRPQRVIHLRTYPDERGLIAASPGALAAATEIAEWSGLALVPLPGRSREGTLERYLTSRGDQQMVTLAVPASDRALADEAWTAYRDAILNLLLDEDFETRKLARQRGESHSAKRESTWGSNAEPFRSDDGFRGN